MGHYEPRFIPRLMPAPRAASYLGISETKLRELNIPRRILDGKRLYDVFTLDQYADSLTVEGEMSEEDEATKCDRLFGFSG